MPGSLYCEMNHVERHQGKKKSWKAFHCLKVLTICIMAMVFVFGMKYAYGQEETIIIEAVGTAFIDTAGVEAAKQEAIANGLVSAVDKEVAEILTVEQITRHFQAIHDIILNNSDKYISDYKLLTEAVTGKRYSVFIQVKISGKKLKDRLVKSGMMQAQKIRVQHIEIIVQGTRNLSNFIKFREGLKEINGVKTVQVSDMQSDEATVSVAFQGNAKAFTDALVLKKYDTFSIRIFEISKNKLRVELIPG